MYETHVSPTVPQPVFPLVQKLAVSKTSIKPMVPLAKTTREPIWMTLSFRILTANPSTCPLGGLNDASGIAFVDVRSVPVAFAVPPNPAMFNVTVPTVPTTVFRRITATFVRPAMLRLKKRADTVA